MVYRERRVTRPTELKFVYSANLSVRGSGEILTFPECTFLNANDAIKALTVRCCLSGTGTGRLAFSVPSMESLEKIYVVLLSERLTALYWFDCPWTSSYCINAPTAISGRRDIRCMHGTRSGDAMNEKSRGRAAIRRYLPTVLYRQRADA